MAFFVSAVVRLKSQTASLRRSLRCVRSGVDKAPSCSRQPGSLPRLHANSTGLPGFVRILCISPRLPPSLPTTSVERNAKGYSRPSTAQVCRFAQTEQSSDRFITWAARIILRHRSFLLSINKSAIFLENYSSIASLDIPKFALALRFSGGHQPFPKIQQWFHPLLAVINKGLH
jgi:hypothetical protein